MKFMVWVTVEKEPTNEVEGDGWKPDHRDVQEILRERLLDREFDTGWIITEVSG